MAQSQQQNKGCLILFGMPFLLIGLGLLFFSIVPALYDGLRMSGWAQTQATLLSVDIRQQKYKSSYVNKAYASYSYEVGGIEYRGARIHPQGDSSDFDGFQTRMGESLRYAYYQRQTVPVWYDPENPADAVLSRIVRPVLLMSEMAFVVVFGGVGAAVIWWAWYGEPSLPGMPSKHRTSWLDRPDWQTGIIRYQPKPKIIMAWFMAIMFLAIPMPMLLQIGDILQRKENAALVALVFPLAAVWLLFRAVRMSLEWWRFGDTPLRLDPFPGAMGGYVGGELLIAVPFDPAARYAMTLDCRRRSENRNHQESDALIWQDRLQVKSQPLGQGSKLVFGFKVPGHLPETGADHYWCIVAHGKMQGVDLQRSFEVPVYRETQVPIRALGTPEPDTHFVWDRAEAFCTTTELAIQPERDNYSRSVRIESILPIKQPMPRLRIFYPMLRNIGLQSRVAMVGGIFIGVPLFFCGLDKVPGFFCVLASIFGLIGLLSVLFAIYNLLSSLTVGYDTRELSIIRRFLGIVISYKRIHRAEIKSVQIKKMTVRENNNMRYRIIMETIQGKKMDIAEDLDSYSNAEQALEFFQEVFGLSRKSA